MGRLLKFLLLLLVAQKAVGQNKLSSDGEIFLENTYSGHDETPPSSSPCEGFEVAYGAARAYTNLWLIAEHHSLQEKTLDCIEILTKEVKKHTIYVEGQKAEEKISCDAAYPGLTNKPGRTCKGWDDPEALDEMDNYLSGSEEIKGQHKLRFMLLSYKETYESYKLEGMKDEGFDKILKAMKADLRTKKKSTREFDVETNIKATEWLLEQRKNGKSYRQAFNNIDQSFGKDARQLVTIELKDLNKAQKLLDRRQKALLSTVQYHPVGQFGIFVAGAFHLDDRAESQLKPSPALVKAIKNHLVELADENPSAMLVTQGP